ncbi:MAG: tetratricopeptide repeat protein [Acidobacteria bacterium]|nr:tetratricopeptide repeat protein [Acidobacteriota bacterium]
MRFAVVGLVSAALAALGGPLEKARDAQDRAALGRSIQELSTAAASRPKDPAAQYKLAQAQSYLAEVSIEQRDKNAARSAAENGIQAAEKATSLKADSSEYHRMLGTLCGQAIAGGNLLIGMKYGKCALDEVNKAIQLDPKNPMGYLSRGVGNYYLPAQFGGGVDKAIADFQKTIEMDPKIPEAHLWLGVALRKANRNAEARKAFEKSLQLNPARVWAKQQLDKTPVQ